MGEAVYHLRATFSSKAAAKEGAIKLKSFLHEVDKAYNFWQENRGKKPAEFWPTFKTEFPNVYELLKTVLRKDYSKPLPSKTPGGFSDYALAPVADGDCNNGLSGVISFVGMTQDINSVKVRGDEVFYASEVWHMASWDALEKYCKEVLKASHTAIMQRNEG